MSTEELINKVTSEMIIKLKKSRLLKDNRQSTFTKTELILRNYNSYCAAVRKNPDSTVMTKKLIDVINHALKTIDSDPYYKIIELYYFKHKSREIVAEHFNVDARTITRNKNRLINKLKVILFSDESISELYDL